LPREESESDPRLRYRSPPRAGGPGLEEARGGVVEPAHRVVVEHEALDATVVGEHARLRLDLLRGEDAPYGSEERVATEQLEVARELLDPVDVAAPLDLDRDRRTLGVAR